MILIIIFKPKLRCIFVLLRSHFNKKERYEKNFFKSDVGAFCGIFGNPSGG